MESGVGWRTHRFAFVLFVQFVVTKRDGVVLPRLSLVYCIKQLFSLCVGFFKQLGILLFAFEEDVSEW
mgnify:CR=1 FL=1